MINIFENPKPIKTTGLTSLIVSFEYNKKIWDELYCLDIGTYLKKYNVWEFPCTDTTIKDLLKVLRPLDDIQISWLVEDTNLNQNSEDLDPSKKPLTSEEIESLHFKPYPHQITGINFGLEQGKWLLLDSMGLGKTLEIIGLAETLKKRNLIEHCLVICGVDSLRSNWKAEIEKFSNYKALVLGEKKQKNGKLAIGTLQERADQLKNPIEELFVITNAAAIRDEAILEALKKSKNKFDLIVVDEIHRMANSQSQQGKNLLKLDSPYKVGATGTLLTNNPISCYLPLKWVGVDNSTLTNFKDVYCNFGGFNGYEIVGYKNLKMLHDEIQYCSIRRTLAEVRDDMPEKIIEYKLLDMSPKQTKFYNDIYHGVKLEAAKVEISYGNLLALTTRLRQATACPEILTESPVDSVKIDYCLDRIAQYISQNQKVVVLSNFKLPVEKLAKELEQYHPLLITGDTTDLSNTMTVNKFQSDPSALIMLGTHSKLGTGFTLNAATHMIMIDTPFTYSTFSQSCDRIYRITNKEPVYIEVLLCKNTIDERVRQIIENKKYLSETVVETPEYQESSKAELLDLLN